MFDFPNAPATNQTYLGYIWDGEKWTSNATLSPPPVPPPTATSQRGYIFGLNLSIATQPTITVAPGMAADSAGTVMMSLAAALTKTTAVWAAGNNVGGLDTGAIANATWYHWFLIYNPTTLAVDVIFSATATPDAGPLMPSGFTRYRRIGSLLTNASSQWVLFTQTGDEFLWSVPFGDVNSSTLGTTAQLFTLTVPTGVNVRARIRGHVSASTVGVAILVNSPLEATAVQNAVFGNRTAFVQVAGSGIPWGELTILTNLSAQVRAVASAASTFTGFATYGWIDRRGKDA